MGNKPILKIVIFTGALLITAASLYYTNALVSSLANREKKLIDLFAKAQTILADVSAIENHNRLVNHLDKAIEKAKNGNDELAKLIEQIEKLFYEQSQNNEIAFLFMEINSTNDFIPVVLANENHQAIGSRNIDLPPDISPHRQTEILNKRIKKMAEVYKPIAIEGPGFKRYIYYDNSALITRLKIYPYLQLLVIGALAIIAYIAFSSSRRAEQNRLWAGLAKETAHQLGTPLSSLMAWTEFLRDATTKDLPYVITEIEKDIVRFQLITNRFSSIGSEPTLKPEDVEEVILSAIGYLRNRISKNVAIEVNNFIPKRQLVRLNRSLFEWVIENLCKNAVDAMPEGRGRIDISIQKTDGKVLIDVADTGKGIPKNKIKNVFEPGFTTKKRGWGLGLALARRIIQAYHRGHIFVKSSELGKGTTFRIVLKVA